MNASLYRRRAARSALLGLAVLLGLAGAGPVRALAQPSEPLPALLGRTHVHGLAFDPARKGVLWIATHHGFFALGQNGTVQRLSNHTDDLMGFTPHPRETGTLYASGHPATGGNLGFLRSRDGGRTWQRLALGVNGPVDFHQLDISLADPKVIYGVYGTLQVSRDGGGTWSAVGEALSDAIDLGTSTLAAERLYLATSKGLRVSTDGGRSWAPAHPVQDTATLVTTQADGTVYGFIVGVGLVRAKEPALKWEVLATDFGKGAVMHLAVDPHDPQRVVAATHRGVLYTSSDGGRRWSVLAAPRR